MCTFWFGMVYTPTSQEVKVDTCIVFALSQYVNITTSQEVKFDIYIYKYAD